MKEGNAETPCSSKEGTKQAQAGPGAKMGKEWRPGSSFPALHCASRNEPHLLLKLNAPPLPEQEGDPHPCKKTFTVLKSIHKN